MALAGPPNSGKSSLVRALTHATPAVGDYPFTTREAMPGMMPFEDIAFQLVDLPPLSEQHVEPWVFDLVRHADLVWVVLDGENALEGFDEARQVLDARNVGLYPRVDAASRGDNGRRLRPALVVLDRPRQARRRRQCRRRGRAARASLAARGGVVGAGAGLDALKRRTFEAFDIMRVYTKQPGKPRDGARRSRCRAARPSPISPSASTRTSWRR